VDPIRIRTFGEFSLQYGENKISDQDNRSKKMWQLLAYLLCRRPRVIPQKELIELLWGDDPSSSNPENVLRITFHRVRTMLDRLYPNAGHQVILYKDSGYAWNPEVPIELDSERFDTLCSLQTEDPSARLDAYLEAIELYRGEYLEKLSSETWVIPITTHFHNLYVAAVLESIPLLSAQNQHQTAADLCRAAIAVEPYHEPLYQHLMQQLAALNDPEGAAAVYEELSRRLFDDFGIRPSEETKEIYRAAAHSVSEQVLPMDLVLEHLQEPDAPNGAMECEYDYFKVLCYAESRAMARSGRATHIALLSISADPAKQLTKSGNSRAVGQVGEQIRLNLRRGDVFSRCSVSQYILMLPGANYENSCMVCRRVIGAFHRKHPHSTLQIHFIVQPLSDSSSVLHA